MHAFISQGKSFLGHADELERSFIQLTKQTMNKELWDFLMLGIMG